jgi:hypothetical protein
MHQPDDTENSSAQCGKRLEIRRMAGTGDLEETNERSGMVGFRIPKRRSHIGNVMMSVAAGVAASCSDPRVADHAVSGGEIRILGWARLGVGLLREPHASSERGLIC